MVTKYGMSDRLGPISFDSSGHSIFIGRDFGTTKSYSEETAATIDEEVKHIFDQAYAKCEALLRELRGLLAGTGEYSLDFGDGTTQQGYIVLRPVSMTYRTSTYEQSRAIIDRLSASDNINRISDLSIRRDERSGGGQGYQTVLTVTYFEVAP